MAAIFNVVTKARLDEDGNFQRQKVRDIRALSMAYGLYLGDTVDKYGSSKAFFLMTSLVPGNRDILTPSEFRSASAFSSISLDEFPFSKKFTADDRLIEFLVVGLEYWFAYTSEPISKSINNRMTTYEQLDLVAIADTPGVEGIKSLFPVFKIQSKGTQQPQHQA